LTVFISVGQSCVSSRFDVYFYLMDKRWLTLLNIPIVSELRFSQCDQNYRWLIMVNNHQMTTDWQLIHPISCRSNRSLIVLIWKLIHNNEKEKINWNISYHWSNIFWVDILIYCWFVVVLIWTYATEFVIS
jgi:hypothetical protein